MLDSMTADFPLGSRACARCGRTVSHSLGFRINGDLRCLRCTLLQRSLILRSLFTAVVVGSLLTAVNQADVLIEADFPTSLYWKIPLNYCVPFLVATWGALINNRA
jgi:hypothetical protein